MAERRHAESEPVSGVGIKRGGGKSYEKPGRKRNSIRVQVSRKGNYHSGPREWRSICGEGVKGNKKEGKLGPEASGVKKKHAVNLHKTDAGHEECRAQSR